MPAVPQPITTENRPRRPVNGRFSSYRQLLLARMKELYREPELIFWIFIFPVLLAGGLGVAFRAHAPSPTAVAIVSGPGAARARALIADDPNLQVSVLPAPVALNDFRFGRVALVVIPGPQGQYTFRLDPARSESQLARLQVNNALQQGAGRRDPISVGDQVASESGSRYIDFLIPGLLGMNLMNSGMWGVGFALVEMRQRKLLKRLVATPMPRSQFLAALATSRLVLMLVEMVLLLGIGVLGFRMQILGSLLTIVVVGAVGAVSFAGLGLLAACRAQKIESVSGLINAVMMPMWVFSGVFFSYQRFPSMLQPLIRGLPLTALNDALRAVILEGASLRSQALRLLILAVWGCGSALLALRWFRWA
ncbi:MAG: ABC transporter permease [Terriglobales bacterium]